jgi:hypothetical protein
MKPAPEEFDISTVEWTVSSYSGGGGNCVEVGCKDGFVLVRDSKSPETPSRVFTPAEWMAFVLAVRDGEFDLHS